VAELGLVRVDEDLVGIDPDAELGVEEAGLQPCGQHQQRPAGSHAQGDVAAAAAGEGGGHAFTGSIRSACTAMRAGRRSAMYAVWAASVPHAFAPSRLLSGVITRSTCCGAVPGWAKTTPPG